MGKIKIQISISFKSSVCRELCICPHAFLFFIVQIFLNSLFHIIAQHGLRTQTFHLCTYFSKKLSTGMTHKLVFPFVRGSPWCSLPDHFGHLLSHPWPGSQLCLPEASGSSSSFSLSEIKISFYPST